MRKFCFVLFMLLAASWSTFALDPNNFSFRQKISFPNYTRPDTLTNFPVLVRLDGSIPNLYREMVSPTGGDLRFTDGTGTNDISFEVESWNTNGESIVWVQVPVLSNNACVFMYWGNAADTNLPASASNGAVWSEGFHAVYHMADAIGNPMDSTSNNVLAVNNGVDFTGQGFINGAANAADVGDDFFLTFTSTSFTAEVWYFFDRTDEGGWNTIFGRNGGTWHHLLINDLTRNVGFYYAGGGDFHDSGVALDLGEWHHLVIVADGANYELFHNGTRIMNDPGFFVNSPARPLNLISTANGAAQTAFGLMDEVRLSTQTRSSNWVWAAWLNSASNDFFNQLGPQEVLQSNLVINVAPPTSITTNGANLNGWLISTGASPTFVSVYYGTSDGGTNLVGAWDFTNNLGVNLAPVPVNYAFPATGLTPNVEYFYRYRATNATEEWWSDSQSFTSGWTTHRGQRAWRDRPRRGHRDLERELSNGEPG